MFKTFLAESVIDEDGYALYRQRNNKVTTKKGKFVSKAIKYLKKGPDRAMVVIQENVKGGQNGTSEQVLEVDEIKNF
ncbi:hypothetical protein Tco_1282640 [Tanacetum coccineum]